MLPLLSWSSSGGGIVVVLYVISGCHGFVNVEAFSHGVIAVGLRVEVWLGGVEAPTPLLRQLLSQCGERVASEPNALRSAYLWEAWAFSHRVSVFPCHYAAWRGQLPFHLRIGTRTDCPSQGCRSVIYAK